MSRKARVRPAVNNRFSRSHPLGQTATVSDSGTLMGLLRANMRDAREGQNVTLAQMTELIGVTSRGFLSEVETGPKIPSPRVVTGYDEHLNCNGLLIGLLEDYQSAKRSEASARRGAKTIAEPRRIPGDAVEFVRESPDDIELYQGEVATKTWTVRNTGTVLWEERRLMRTGRVRGREIPASAHFVPILRTEPGQVVMLAVDLRCAAVPGTRMVRFKMVDTDGRLLFPDDEHGVTVEVTSHAGERPT